MISFTPWLAAQQHRDDLIGDLAVNVVADFDAPPAVTVRDVRKRMRSVRALRRFFLALDQAAQEYRAIVPTNVVPFPRARAMLSR
jgi:hypothetical protein